MKFYKTLQNFTVSIVMAFLVLTSASCSNMTKEEGMTTLYEKIKGGGGGGGAALFENLTPNEIDTKMTGVTATSIQLSNLKAGSVFIFKGISVAGPYYGKVLVTKVESNKFGFRVVLYNPNKSVAATDDDEDLAKGGNENLGTVTDGTPVGNTEDIQIKMAADGKIEVSTPNNTKILLLN